MSLPLPTPTAAPRRANRLAPRHTLRLAAVAGTFAVLMGMAVPPAAAQNGPLSLTPPAAPPSGPISKDPGMVPAQKAVQEKRYGDAVEAFDRVLAANPRNAQARFQRAWSLAQAGREDDAIRAFAEMAQDFPELPEPHNNLALLYAKRGDLKRAEAELQLAIEARPDFALAYTNLGDVYRRLAEQAYAEALRRNPGDAHAASALSQIRPSATSSPTSSPTSSAPAADAPASAPAAAPRPARRTPEKR